MNSCPKVLFTFFFMGVLALFSGGQAFAESRQTLFPTDLPGSEWVQFQAAGFSKPVVGVIYRFAQPAVNGMPLGAIDTGCIDLETSGLFGYCTIFNTHVPRRGPLNLPFLGISVGGQTWVLCDPTQTKQGEGNYQKPLEPLLTELRLEGVKTAQEIHSSLIPGIVFEVHLRNLSDTPQRGTVFTVRSEPRSEAKWRSSA